MASPRKADGSKPVIQQPPPSNVGHVGGGGEV